MTDNLAVKKDRRLYPHFLLGQFLGVARLADIPGLWSRDDIVARLQELTRDYDEWRQGEGRP